MDAQFFNQKLSVNFWIKLLGHMIMNFSYLTALR